MSRWRPPVQSSTALITPSGQARLKSALDHLWCKERPAVVTALAAAAAEGDRSENAEYIYRKKQLAEIDRRVRYLSHRLTQLHVVAAPPKDRSAVFFGATVTVRSSDGATEQRYCLVGPDESCPSSGRISIDAPLAQALLRKHVGDSCTIESAAGAQAWTIVAIAYLENQASLD